MAEQKQAAPKKKQQTFEEFVVQKHLYYNAQDKKRNRINLYEEKHHPEAHMLGKTEKLCEMCDPNLPSFKQEHEAQK